MAWLCTLASTGSENRRVRPKAYARGPEILTFFGPSTWPARCSNSRMSTIDETTPWPHARPTSRAPKQKDRTIDVDSSEFQVVDSPVSTKSSWLSSGALFAASLSLAVGSAALLLAEVRNTRSGPHLPAPSPAARAPATVDTALLSPHAPDEASRTAAVRGTPEPTPRTEQAHRSSAKREHGSVAPPTRSRASGKHARPARSDSRTVRSHANRTAKVNKF